MDQRNPWQPEAHGAHHAIDMLFLWGAYTYGDNEGVKNVVAAFQEDFINFITAGQGEVDEVLGWKSEEVRVYGGPDGYVGVVGREEVARRRRIGLFEGVLRELGDEVVANAAGVVGSASNGAASLGVQSPLGRLWL